MGLSCKIIMTPRDERLLHYLFENRGGTLSDINRDIFQNRSIPTVHKRLKKLREARLIEMTATIDLPERYFYFISPRGLKRCYPDSKNLGGVKLKSNNIRHDFLLSKVRNILEGSKFIHHYYTENMMSLDTFQWQIGDIFKYNRQQFRPDAIFITMSKDGPIYNAVELETSQKGSKRYNHKMKYYYFNREISYVILISPSKTIEKRIMMEEKKIRPKGNTKFFYGHLKSLLEKKMPFTFKNCNGAKYDL